MSSRKGERAGEVSHLRSPVSNKNREKGFRRGPHVKGNKRSYKERLGYCGGMRGRVAQKKEEGGQRRWRLDAKQGRQATRSRSGHHQPQSLGMRNPGREYGGCSEMEEWGRQQGKGK